MRLMMPIRIQPVIRILMGVLALSAATARGDADSRQPTDEWTTLGRSILKQLVEINTTHAFGSTIAARAAADRLIAAGFPKSDITQLAPPDHPTKGNMVVRLHGRGKGKPILYMGHLDVVEAPRDTWTYDPFKLTEKDGSLYGRGTIDMKGQDAAMLVSLIRLRKEGFVPDRDIILALTADEEAGGDANGIQFLLKDHPDLIDAGLAIDPDTGGSAVAVNGRKLFIGVETSEKMYLTFGIEATDKGGHSSRPTPENPIFHLAAALDKLAKFQFPVHLTDTTKLYFARRAAFETGQIQTDMRSVAGAAPDPAALDRLSKIVEDNIMLRTTCTATEITGGQGESALPERARATIQCRVVPGETQDQIAKTLGDVFADPAVKLNVTVPADPSPESPPDPRILDVVQGVAADLWPSAHVIPVMEPGATDGAYTRSGGIPTYCVDAMFTESGDDRLHGRDERIGIDVFRDDIEFTYRLMKDLSSTLPASPSAAGK